MLLGVMRQVAALTQCREVAVVVVLDVVVEMSDREHHTRPPLTTATAPVMLTAEVWPGTTLCRKVCPVFDLAEFAAAALAPQNTWPNLRAPVRRVEPVVDGHISSHDCLPQPKHAEVNRAEDAEGDEGEDDDSHPVE